jgi:hypothetical protein
MLVIKRISRRDKRFVAIIEKKEFCPVGATLRPAKRLFLWNNIVIKRISRRDKRFAAIIEKGILPCRGYPYRQMLFR